MSRSGETKQKRNKTTSTTDHLLVEETLKKNPFFAAYPADLRRLIAKTFDETKVSSGNSWKGVSTLKHA